MARIASASRILAAVVALLLIGAVVMATRGSSSERTLTADFPQTNALYVGSSVKVIGVPVGKVTKIVPRGNTVRVTMEYSDDVKIPDDAKALVVSPSIVGDRFVQLAPAYSGGPVLEDGAALPESRTQVPVELDKIYESLDDLSVALGPKGANKDGALARLVDDTAGQLDGQGQQINQTIKDFGKLSTTLSNNKDELFGSLNEVQQFVRLLKNNDDTVRAFNASTAQVSTVLEGERGDLKEALRLLSLALIDVNDLVTENRGKLRENVRNLRTLSQVLANRDDELEKSAKPAASALVNVALAYNPDQQAGSLDTHTNLPEILSQGLANPTALVCGLLGETPGTDGACSALTNLLDGLGLGDLLGGLSPPRVAPASTPDVTYQGPQGTVAEMMGGK